MPAEWWCLKLGCPSPSRPMPSHWQTSQEDKCCSLSRIDANPDIQRKNGPLFYFPNPMPDVVALFACQTRPRPRRGGLLPSVPYAADPGTQINHLITSSCFAPLISMRKSRWFSSSLVTHSVSVLARVHQTSGLGCVVELLSPGLALLAKLDPDCWFEFAPACLEMVSR